MASKQKLKLVEAMNSHIGVTLTCDEEGPGEFLASVSGDHLVTDAWATTRGTAVRRALEKWANAYETKHGHGAELDDDGDLPENDPSAG
jgi:hypothetical protein